MGIFGAITGIIGGIQGASAAHDAADAQVAGYKNAAGTVNAAVGNANPIIQQSADTASKNLTNTASDVNSYITGLGSDQAANVVNTARSGTAALNPYTSLGATAAGTLGQLTDPHANITALMQNLDPGYSFRLAQGQQALDNSASARGLSDSGAGLKATARYNQDYAANEYQNTFSRLSSLANQGQQASEFGAGLNTQAATTAAGTQLNAGEFGGSQLYNGTALAGNWGVNAGTNQASNLVNAGVYTGNTQVASGNAIARGDLGAAGAWNQALTGIGAAGDAALGMWGGNLWGNKISTGKGIDPFGDYLAQGGY